MSPYARNMPRLSISNGRINPTICVAAFIASIAADCCQCLEVSSAFLAWPLAVLFVFGGRNGKNAYYRG